MIDHTRGRRDIASAAECAMKAKRREGEGKGAVRLTRSDSRWKIAGVISMGGQMNRESKVWDLRCIAEGALSVSRGC